MTRILGEDNTPETVTLNAPFKDNQGIERLYDVRVGRYGVQVDVGPSFATKRQETVGTMMELTKAFPALFQVAGDLLVKNMDWPGAQEIAERLMSLLPPELRPDPNPGDPKQQLAQLRAAIPQLQQKLQAMNAYAQEQEAAAQEATQETQQLKLAAQSKAAELTVKQEETMARQMAEQAKLGLEEQKLQLEAQKLELEEQKLALEVAKAQAEIGDIQTRMQATAEDMGMNREARQAMTQGYDAIVQALDAVQAQLGMVTERIEEDAQARQAPKQVNITRQADGSLVGAVRTEGQGERTVEIRPSTNGFQGEMS